MFKFKRMRQEAQQSRRGFSRWIQPQMHKYFLGCCDCDLVHEMQFRVLYSAKDGKIVPRVQFRVRRAPAYTARERKRKSSGVQRLAHRLAAEED